MVVVPFCSPPKQVRFFLLSSDYVHAPVFAKIAPDLAPESNNLMYKHDSGYNVLSIGGVGSWQRIHRHVHAWLLQVEGRKLWWLGPSESLRPEQQPEIGLDGRIRGGRIDVIVVVEQDQHRDHEHQ